MTHEANADGEREQTITLRPGEEAGPLNREAGIASPADLELIYQHAHVGFCLFDRELRFVWIDDRLAAMNGIPAEEHLGRTVRELVPTLADTLEPIFQRVLETGLPVLRVEAHGSTLQQPLVERDWLASYAPVRSPDGHILGLRCVVEEITERSHAEREIRRSEERYRSLVDLSPDGIFVTRKGRIVFVNPAGVKLFGASTLGDLIGRSPLDLFHAGCHALIRERVERLLVGSQVAPTVEHQIISLDGRVRDVEVSSTLMGDPDERAIQVVVRDITERRQIAEALRVSEERLSLAVHGTGMGTWDLDLRTGQTICSDTHFGILGYEPARGGASTLEMWRERVHPEDREAVQRAIEDAKRQHGRYEMEYRIQHAGDGETRWLSAFGRFVYSESGEAQRFLGILFDVTQRHLETAAIRHQAIHDPLTGLINRAELERRLERVLGEVDAVGPHALLYLDLDQFKLVNDTCGHAAGDALLRQLPAVLERRLRKRDTLARLGGDEFGVLLEHCSQADAFRIAQHLVEDLQAVPFAWEDKTFTVGASVGLVTIPAGGETLATVMSAADRACYVAKDKGRSRVQIYEADDEELQQRQGEMRWIPRLRRALDEDRFSLHAQPVVALANHGADIEYQEVLLRLDDGEGGLLLPDVFIHAAERYQQMGALDRWVVRAAFSHLAASGNRTLYGINLSAQSLSDPAFLEFALDQLNTAAVVPGKIVFEITETAAITDFKLALRFVYALKERGCRFALDDFGSGVASFGYLKALPIDYLKIDGRFVRSIHEDPFADAVVTGIHAIARTLGLRTIAESVENEAVLKRVRAIGVDCAQGYAIALPGPLVDP